MDNDNVNINFAKFKSSLEKIDCVDIQENFTDRLYSFVRQDVSLVHILLSNLYQSLEKVLEQLKDVTKKKDHPKLDGDVGTCQTKKEPINAGVQWKSKTESRLVQIKADKAEVDRRIAAFIERKQTEVDDINKREFCNLMHTEAQKDLDSSCARTDAVFVPRLDSKSHVKVSKVLNQYGPQTRLLQPPEQSLAWKRSHSGVTIKQELAGASRTNAGESINTTLLQGLKERLRNLEDHVGIKHGPTDGKEVFKRVRLLEERVLFLESLSPEYFNFMPNKRSKSDMDETKKSSFKQNLNVQEIEDKISILKQRLVIKEEVKPEPI